MQADLMKQWTEMSQSSLETLKQIGAANVETLNGMMKSQFAATNMAELIQTSMKAVQELNQTNSTLLNSMLQKQMSAVNLNATATAFKELGDISSNTMNGFLQRQVELMKLYTESTNRYVESLKQAKTPEEAIKAQTELFKDLQEKLKGNALQTMQVLNSIRETMQAWSDKMMVNK